MKYLFRCMSPIHAHTIHYETGEVENEGVYFEVEATMSEGPTYPAVCPECNDSRHTQRIFVPPPVHYNASGFSKDYFSRNPGRNQSWDKKENLNENWSKHYGEDPPKEDSVGTYDGRPRR